MSNSWLKDKAVAEWFSQVKDTKSIQKYKREFPRFLKFVQKITHYESPSEIIDSRVRQLNDRFMSEKRFWETLSLKYKSHLELRGYGKRTIINHLNTMQSFFSLNHVQLVYARNELLGSIKPSEKTNIPKWIPSNEEVRILYKMAQNARDRAIILMLYQSGLNPVDICSLKIENFNFYNMNGDWRIPSTEDYYLAKLTEKTGVLQQTCISREALEEIKIMLLSRGYPTNGALFVSARDKPLKPSYLENITKSIVEKAFNEKAKLWKTKNLRGSFKNALTKVHIDPEVINAMLGRKRSSTKGSYQLPQETIKTMYSEVLKFLTISGYDSKATIKIEELESTTTQKTDSLASIISAQQTQIIAQNQKITEISKHLGTLDEAILRLQHELQKLQKKP